MKKYIIQITLMLVLSISVCAQEFAYVTDSLQLRVYANPSADSEVLQVIESGDSVEVLASEGGYSQITTYDDTKGWVKSAFLVTDPPAKLLYYSVSEKNKELETEIESIKNNQQTTIVSISSEENAQQVEELQEALVKAQESNQQLQQQVAEIENVQTALTTSSPASIDSEIIAMTGSMSMRSILIGFVAMLVVGFLLGIKFSSMRLKKRLHGFSL